MKSKRGAYKKRLFHLLGMLTLGLLVLQLLVLLVSWLITAAIPDSSVRSLLSAEGMRWFVGHLAVNLQSPILVALVLVSVAGGSVARAVGAYRRSPSAAAVRAVLVELLLFLVVALLLTAIPHAMLLSVTGSLFPSSFSDGLLPLSCFIVTVCSLTYCMVSREVRTVAAAYEVLCHGAKYLGLLLPLYIVGAQLCYSLLFVLGY